MFVDLCSRFQPGWPLVSWPKRPEEVVGVFRACVLLGFLGGALGFQFFAGRVLGLLLFLPLLPLLLPAALGAVRAGGVGAAFVALRP